MKINFKNIGASVLTAVMMGISFPPFPFHLLIFIALIPYLNVISKKEKLLEINRFTYLTFFIFSVLTLYWVGSWQPQADPFLIVGGIMLLFVNPALFMIPASLFYFARKRFSEKVAFALLPLFWVTYEYIYSATDFRFPWLMLSNAIPYLTTFIQCADVIGAYGLTVLIVCINIAIMYMYNDFRANKRISLRYIVVFTLLTAVPVIYGIIKINTYKSSNNFAVLTLVQPDLNPWDKWGETNLSGMTDMYLRYSDSGLKQKADVILWPETALPVYLLSGIYPETVNKINNYTLLNNVYILTGLPQKVDFFDSLKAPKDAKKTIYGYSFTTYNSAVLFSPNTINHSYYGKIKLVPFGEKVPYVEDLPFLGDFIKWEVGISSWNTGTETKVFKTISKGKEINIAPLICFESIFPDFATSFVRKGANVLAVITNDSWYGNSSGPYQHKSISVLRAVENRRSVVRAANSGISCYINPLGYTVNETKMFTKDVLTVKAELRNNITFFSEYPMIIPSFAGAVSLFVFGLSFILKLKKVLNIE